MGHTLSSLQIGVPGVFAEETDVYDRYIYIYYIFVFILAGQWGNIEDWH